MKKNLWRGFNRIFILIACGFAIFGGILGFVVAEEKFGPDPVAIFLTLDWGSDSNHAKYVWAAQDIVPPEDIEKIKKFPPVYNATAFKKAFPEKLKTTTTSKIGGAALGVIVTFIGALLLLNLSFLILYFGGLFSFSVLSKLFRWIREGFGYGQAKS